MRRVTIYLALLMTIALLAFQMLAQDSKPTVRIESNAVLVPTLVTKGSGEIVYDLTPENFAVYVDGVQQDFQMDVSPENKKMSLIVAVQRGGGADMLFERKGGQEWQPGGIAGGLATMVENFIGEADSETALVAFDSRVELLQDFAQDFSRVSQKLNKLEGSQDNGAAILDVVRYSYQLFGKRSPDRRHVLLLISQLHDQGSKEIALSTLLRDVGMSNGQIFSITFRPAHLEMNRDLRDKNYGEGAKDEAELLPLISLGVNSLKENAAKALAGYTGGEYHLFSDRQSFENNLNRLTNHFRNNYLIGFRAKNTRPGYHRIDVRLRNVPNGLTVRHRECYWGMEQNPSSIGTRE